MRNSVLAELCHSIVGWWRERRMFMPGCFYMSVIYFIQITKKTMKVSGCESGV